jgi:NAD-dependent dihydropyrimidine dehydrogenase PreA subunit
MVRPIHSADVEIVRMSRRSTELGVPPAAMLARTDLRRSPHMPFVITDACIDNKDLTCIEECPVDCIYEGARRLYINPAECIDCGACEPICPVDAIYPDQSLPEEKLPFIADNAEFFAVVLHGRDAPIGTPGGSEEVGPIDADTELTRAWRA